MTAATMSEAPAIKPKDLRAFSRGVSTAIMALVNNRGVKYRMMRDGNHLVLYPPDRDARPFKIAAHRPDEGNFRYLNEFVDKYLGPLPTDERPAKPDELAPLLTLNTKPPDPRTSPEDEPGRRTDPDGTVWRTHHRATGEPTTFETDGTRYRCTHEGCGQILTSKRLIGVHAGNHKSADLASAGSRTLTKPRAKPWTGRNPDKTPLDAERVQELRDRAGLTWREVGKMIGITPEGIRQWIKRGEVASAWVPMFAAALGVTPEVLTGTGPLPGDPPMPEKTPEPVPVPEPISGPDKPEPTTAAKTPARRTEKPVEARVMPGNAKRDGDAFREIIRTALAALGEDDPYAENARLKRELDDEKAKLALLRETLRTLDE